jgi:hypothetical protein
MAFAHVQGNAANSTANVTTQSVVLGAAPGLGHLVCVGLVLAGAVTALTIHDSNANVYTITPNSPEIFGAGGDTYLAYLLNAPANASATITATWTTGVPAAIWADEFSVTGAPAFFDIDIGGSGTGTAVNAPSITPGNPNSLIYATCGSGGTISAPAAGGTLGAWTGAAGGVQDGDMSEYALSITGAQAVEFTQTTSVAWSAMAMSFSQLQSGIGFYRMPVFWLG